MTDNASIARELFDCFNRRDWDGYTKLLHPDCSYTGGDGEPMPGPEANLAVAKMFAGAMSDARIVVTNQLTSDDTVITEFIGSGTHDGALMDIPATGKKVSMPVCNIIEVRQGKVYAEREYMDIAHLMRQIGVLP